MAKFTKQNRSLLAIMSEIDKKLQINLSDLDDLRTHDYLFSKLVEAKNVGVSETVEHIQHRIKGAFLKLFDIRL